MKVKIKKLHDNAVIPKYAKDGDAGLDLVATTINKDSELYIEYGTGLSVEIPKGYVGLIFPRSSNSNKTLILSNSVGVVDSGYRGEIKLRFKDAFGLGGEESMILDAQEYTLGDKVGQLVIMPYPEIEFEEVEKLADSERGAGGYGSTGK